MARRVLVFQHMEVDSPGRFSDLFRASGATVRVVKPFAGEDIPSLAAYDLLFALGGAMDVWQEEAHPWLKDEKQAIREWVGERAKPFIGICLGHQLLADAMGGEVGMAKAAEVGLHDISLIDGAANHPFFGGVGPAQKVLQWHHAEVKRVPEGARVLASAPGTAVQAIAIGEHALGVQFHFEWTLDSIRGWSQVPEWIVALERHLGAGAHPRLIAEAEPHLPAITRMTETIYSNFMRKTGLQG
jgi:GMP synthase-like glutamine amidotransferase